MHHCLLRAENLMHDVLTNLVVLLCMTTQQSIKTSDEEGGDTPSPLHLPMFITEIVGPNKTNICMGPNGEEMEEESVEDEEEEA
eukprot:7418400-Ditylum_brightwellii.AAC.1